MWQTLSLLLITARKVKMNATSISDMCKKWTMMTNIPSETQQQASHLHPRQISDATANQLPSLPKSHTHHITWQPINSLHHLHTTPTSSRQPINSLQCLHATPTSSHDSQSASFTAYMPRPPHHMTANQLPSPPTRHALLVTWQPINSLHCLHATPTSSHDSQSTPFTAYNQKLDAKQSPILTHLAAPLAAYIQWINSVDKKTKNGCHGKVPWGTQKLI